MADTRGKAANGPGEGEKKADDADAPAPETFSTGSLIEGARVRFGHSPHLVAGALSKGGRKNWSLEDAEARVAEFATQEFEPPEESS